MKEDEERKEMLRPKYPVLPSIPYSYDADIFDRRNNRHFMAPLRYLHSAVTITFVVHALLSICMSCVHCVDYTAPSSSNSIYKPLAAGVAPHRSLFTYLEDTFGIPNERPTGLVLVYIHFLTVTVTSTNYRTRSSYNHRKTLNIPGTSGE